ncbi:MAG: metal-dependent phosphohydrolase [Alphaproteobacteria bacterium]|nr:metal-dependent phosphohydrolase [Alphaproteobacteria bacterium]
MGAIRDDLLEIYGRRAHKRYGLTDVTQLQHALQAAANAEGAGEGPALVLASLLHDVGHMIHDLGEDPAARGVDDTHEARGAAWIAERFGPEVSEPVRLHVPAKRYLCAVEGHYEKLSSDSRRSLALQGGPMTAAEAAAFRATPGADAAIRLRRYCDGAKNPNASPPPLEHFLSYAEPLARDSADHGPRGGR